MNKQGHLAVGALAGSATALILAPSLPFHMPLLWSVLMIDAATVAALLPDLDHKTGTMSQKIQFSASHRKMLRRFGAVVLLVALIILSLHFLALPSLPVPSLSIGILVAGIGAALYALAHLRTLILVGLGLWCLYAWWALHSHWIMAVVGGALLLLPLVKHRGLIHSPEFALLLSAGLWSAASVSPWWLHALCIGILTGWWAHLLGDIFGSEGIHSQLVPWLGIALRWFHNGGAAERTIAAISWIGSFILWVLLLAQLIHL